MEHSTQTRTQAASRLRQWADRPGLRRLADCGLDGALAFVLSAAATGTTPLPVCLGFLASLNADWPALAAAAGGCGGYLLFWGGSACLEPLAGIVAGLLAAAVFAGTELRRRNWFLPVLCAGVTAVLGPVFFLGQPTVSAEELGSFVLRVAAAGVSGAAFSQGRRLTPLTSALTILGLCQILVFRVLDLGLAAATLIACLHPGASGLIWAVTAGAAVDLSRITPVPVTPVLCLSLLTTSLPGLRRRFTACLSPALWALPAMYLGGDFDPVVLIGMFAGGVAALPFPQTQPKAVPPPAPFNRLESAAGTLEYLEDLVSQPASARPQIEALFDQAADQVCRDCPKWQICWEQEGEETYRLLSQAAPEIFRRWHVGELPADFVNRCRQPEAFAQAAEKALWGLRLRRQYETKLQESRMALANQYRFLAKYLRESAKPAQTPGRPRYQIELGIGATGKFGLRASGDRGAHFPGTDCRYYVLLCDGMGAGPGAAEESAGALRLLTGMLQAGMPPEAALETLNDLYVLRETGGFSTADLLELHLDTGRAVLYKWGAAPSYIKHRHSARKIGTAAPPPGVGIGNAHRAEVIRLSLQKGETVVLVSDGLAGEETQAKIAEFAGQSPKALAAALAAAGSWEEDDRTAVAVRLRPHPSALT